MNTKSANAEIVQEKKTKNHFLRYFYIVVIFLILSYTVIWFYLAAKIENEVAAAAQLNNQNEGLQLHCGKIHKIGYPLRIGVGCEGVQLDFSGQVIKLWSPAFSSSAPIYAPQWLKFDMRSPITVETPLASLDSNWSSMTIETDINEPSKMRLIINDLAAHVANKTVGIASDISAKFIRADHDQFGDDAKLHFTFKDLNLPFLIPGEQTKLPPLDGNLDWTIQNFDQHFRIEKNFDPQTVVEDLLGVKGSVDHAKLTFASGGSFSVSGPFAINEQGYIEGKFTIALEDQPALLNTMRLLFPSQATNLQSIFFIIGSMPKDTEGNPTLSLSIENGEVRMGFIRLGKINPI